VISGCSGGGKTTLLTELRHRGLATVDEPGRRIVREELPGGGAALPWVDGRAFARRAIAMALSDMAAASVHSGWVFFDRGLIDAAVALAHLGEEPVHATVGTRRYHSRVFLTPPWREIHVTDDERPHGFTEAVEEYERLCAAYPALGYQTIELPRSSVAARADFMLGMLEAPT
jgi:predicted ATPase